MPTILQFRRGTSAQNNNYTGSAGELTVDTDLEVLRVHDGSTTGGHELVGLTATQTLTNKTLSDFTLSGNITGHVLPSANITYDLGSASQRWNDLYLANSTIYLGASQISANATAVTITNPGGGDFVLAGAGDSSQTAFIGTSVQAASIGNSGAVITGASVSAATIGNSGATLTGTIQTASQPNITGVGTITAGTWQGSTIAVAYGGTGVTSSTGTGSVVLSNSPSLVTPALGTPGSGTLTNCTGLPIVAGTTGTLSVARGGTGATTSTGSGAVVLATSPTLTTPILGTPQSGTLTNCTGLPIDGGTTGTLPVARGGTGVTTSTGSGAVVLSTSPSFSTKITTPVIEKSGTNGVGDIGQSGNKYATIYATTFSGEASSALYADLAEKYVADRYYEPGTVMVFGGEQEVTESMLDYETAVAGVVSTKPAYLMNSEQQGEFVVDIALVGRVPCKVMGPVFKGSVLVTSEHAGVAMAIDNTKFVPGCIIGRAMEDNIEEGIIKTIEVSVGRS